MHLSHIGYFIHNHSHTANSTSSTPILQHHSDMPHSSTVTCHTAPQWHAIHRTQNLRQSFHCNRPTAYVARAKSKMSPIPQYVKSGNGTSRMAANSAAQLLPQWKRQNSGQGETIASVHQRLCWKTRTYQCSKWVIYSTAVTTHLNLMSQETSFI